MNKSAKKDPSTKIQKGNFLIAEPFAQDDIFRQSVILLTDHSEKEGSVGFIINKPLEDITISSLIGDLVGMELPVYIGGPVATDSLYFIHTIPELIEDSIPIQGRIYWGGKFEQIKGLGKAGYLTEDNFKFFVGYSGWTPGQLKEEIENKYWIYAPMDEKMVLNLTVKHIWKKALEQKGDTFAILSDIPKFYHQN